MRHFRMCPSVRHNKNLVQSNKFPFLYEAWIIKTLPLCKYFQHGYIKGRK